ncbi:bifunctional protein FolD 1, mitochondrial-like isoform X2 [Aristolochia californica]|uniref:bifunctional protein FolD 1, mitochondrial-like isoform X2 n=1 Tax=Aristolochia californica TaxID=171875 RepID=UPI0035DD475E
MQALFLSKSGRRGLVSAFKCLNCYNTKSATPPILGPDLPDVWFLSPPARACFRPLFINSEEQVAAVIDGKSMADEIRLEIADEVRRMKDTLGKVPGLAVVLVGERRDSQIYVRNKIKACEEVGITSLMAALPEDCSEAEVVDTVSGFNDNPSVHGILVQLPLPQHMDEEKILNAVSLEKDVDGFHPLNMGNLAMSGREPLFIPCTPKGCIELLLRSGIEIMGKKAVVIGRSNIVGTPTSLLLQRHHATVSIVHAFTKNPELITREADIVVSAAGVPNLVRGSWLKPGAIVIDVGINPVEDSSCEYGYRLIGDVCYEEALPVVSAITPVPGGVGPMTIAMLLSNTLESAKRSYGFIQQF